MGLFRRPARASARLRTPFLALLLGGLLLAGCESDSSGTNGTAEGGVTVGVSLLTLTHPFFQNLSDALQEAAAARGMTITITAAEFDAARQQNQVADFIVQGVDAIVLSPADSKAIGTSIQAANEAGIPVFTADIAVLAEGVEVVTHVATDNYEGGRLAAEAILEATGGTGRVAIIDHPEVESVIKRTEGFHERIEEANAQGANIEIVAQLPGGGVKDRAFRVAEDVLQAHPALTAVFAINDDTALGTVAAIEKAGKSGRIQVIGFDGTQEARQAIRDGAIYADVIQHPRDIGRMTIEAIESYMAGETLPDETLIPATLYRQEDAMQDPMLQGTPADSTRPATSE